MKLFGKRTDKKQPVVPTNMPRTGVVTSVGIEEARKFHLHLPKITFKRLIPSKRTLRSFAIAAVILLVVAALGGVALLIKRHQTQVSVAKANSELTDANKAVQANDTKQALAHAKQALASDPNNVDNYVLVATLTEKDNPKEAQKVYERGLEVFKKQDNPDVDGKHAVTYSAAAGLAEKAGHVEEAKKYYQKVIATADLADMYQQDLVAQAERALKRLK